MKNRLKFIIILLVLGLLFALTLVYYWPKFSGLWQNPKKFSALFLDASQLSSFSVLNLFNGLLLAFLAFLIDFIALGWSKSGIKRLIISPSKTAKIDLFSYFLSVTYLYELLYFVFSIGIFYFITSVFIHAFDFHISTYISNVYFQFAFVFLLGDLRTYLSHRFLHIKPFWEIHAYHHSAEEFNLITTIRGHVFEGGIRYVFNGIFFALIGAPLYSVFLVISIRELYQYLLHSDVNWSFGWFGRWILISPKAHRLHHSIDSEDYNKNYGTFFVWWDRLFGTYKETDKTIVLGIDDNPYNDVNFFKGQIIGVKRFFGVKEKI